MNLIIQPEAGLAPVVRAFNAPADAGPGRFSHGTERGSKRRSAPPVQRGVRVRVLVAHTTAR